jgi:hypothetical protein
VYADQLFPPCCFHVYLRRDGSLPGSGTEKWSEALGKSGYA